MRPALAVTLVLVLLANVLAVLLLTAHPGSADPWPTNNGDGTSVVLWNFTNPSDYALTDAEVTGGSAALKRQLGWWNSTSAADFTGPDSATNANWTRWPGDVVMDSVAGPPTLVTIQPDGATGLDAYLDRNFADTNRGADASMVFDPRGSITRRPILQFSLSAIPAGAVIDDAKVSLYVSGAAVNSPVAEVHSVTAAWDEGQVTWNNRLTGTPWGSAGGDFDAHVVDQLSLNASLGWKTWNVTQLVDLWYRGYLSNNGLILTGPTTGPNFDKTFWSSDYGVDPSLRPKLEVRYRIIGAAGEYVSRVGGPGSLVAWDSISWNMTERSFVTDEFAGSSLDPKWTWTNPPTSYDVGTTTPGSLHAVSTTGGDLGGATFSGNVLANEVAGDFIAIAMISGDPTVSGQKHGLMVLLNNRNWYAIQKVNASGSVNWQAKSTADAATVIRANVSSGNPVPAWYRIGRSGNTFTASTSSDGVSWTTQDTYTPAFEYPLEIRIAVFLTDGLSGTAHTVDANYVRVNISNDATVAVSTRTGNTSTVDASWSAWSAPYPAPSGSPMLGSTNYAQFRLTLSVAYPDHTPNIGDVNLSWATYPASGTVETADFAPGDLAEWDTFDAVHTLNGQTVAYAYSTDSGGNWTPLTPPQFLLGVSTASGTIRFRATLSTASATLTPVVREMRLTYRHTLDHFYVTASSTATAGASFSMTVTAKDAGNATMTWWTGAVTLDAVLPDGVTPASGVLGVTSLAISAGGTATLTTETYTKAEVIRIRASLGTVSGLTGPIDVSPGSLNRIAVTPNDVTLLPFDSQILTAVGYDAWNNTISGLPFGWSVTGGVGSLNLSTGPSVNFTASPPPANGTVEASVGAIVGIAQIHVVSGIRPWVTISAPASGDHLTGAASVDYTNSSDAVSIRFDYDDGSGWTLIGMTVTLNGTFLWDTTGLDFAGASLRAIVTNNRATANTTTVTPIEVDNTPPSITVGPAVDSQSTSGTITLIYATSPDVVQVNFAYFDGAWNSIGSDVTVDGSYVWTPGIPINGVTVRATAVDEVGLWGTGERLGIGNRTVGTNPPSIQGIPTLHVRVGTAYGLNLSFYVSDPDTGLASLSITVADPANVTVLGGPYPNLTITYGTSGTFVLTVWVSDGTDTAWAFLTIIASGVSPPVVLLNPPAVAFDEDTTSVNGFGVPAGTFIEDPDGDPLTFEVLGNRTVHVRVNAGGTIDFWADPNWYGSEAMRLRATDPTGGFAETSFIVLVRSVNDAPILALIPDLSIDAGVTYVLDLGPFLSDVDTPLSSLTVTTDSPYVTVNGYILTLAFPSDWTSVDIQITVSDGSAVALQTMRVAFRVTPTWWSSPYVLAIPPIGVFVVVAMFAQRARWRPTKAFLVDERGRMIREFTLDPSCQVSYDEAVKAGALDAVEKPIKVAKYHAQTVRGDALAVVLLAVGPVTVEQVEFAREMLVQIQDKFEDAVKSRLEEARAYEAELGTRANAVEEQQAAMETRAAEIESMMQQVETSQSEVSAESAAIATREQSLEAREVRLAEDSREVDDLARQLEELRVSLDKRSAKIQEQAGDVVRKTEALVSRENAVGPREVAVAKREEAAGVLETKLKAQADHLALQVADMEAKTTSLADREAVVTKGQEELRAVRQEFEHDQKDLLEFRRTIDARVAEVERAEADVASKRKELEERESRLEPKETDLSARQAAIVERETGIQDQRVLVEAATREVTERMKDLEAQEREFARECETFEATRKTFEVEKHQMEELKGAIDARMRDAHDLETSLTQKATALEERQARLAPLELELAEGQKRLEEQQSRLSTEDAQLHAKAQQVETDLQAIETRSRDLSTERSNLEEARATFERERASFESRVETVDAELRKRNEDLNAQARAVGEGQLQLSQEKQTFEMLRADKSQWIASKEIELEARELAVAEKEGAVRGQAEQNAQQLADLAAREETLEIEADRLEKDHAELDARKGELDKLAKNLDAKAVQLREEEARKAEEYRTWQATLESEQTLLRQQQETFEKEMSELRDSWAGRMLRVQQREEDVTARESKIRSDVDWVAKSEEELGRREKATQIALDEADFLKREVETTRKDLEQRAFEVEARERALREEAAKHADELMRRDEALRTAETSVAEKRAEMERDSTARTFKLQEIEAQINRKAQAYDAKIAEITGREARLASLQDSVRQEQERVVRERTDLQATGEQLQAKQVELAQQRQRHAEESARYQAEVESIRQSLATKEAELTSERERLERESTSLQDRLGAKAQELVSRERSVSAREEELRGEEQDFESRIRAVESRERQVEAHAAEIAAQSAAVAKGQADLDARAVQLDATARKFALEQVEKQKEWEAVRASLKSQEAQITASAESRMAQVSKQLAELEARERSLAATAAQLEAEKARLADAGKAQSAKDAEAAAAMARAEKRFQELKARETEILEMRQAFEGERATWANRRAEELRQLEATRDAVAEQTQKAERLTEEAQRRALLANDAERAGKRQADELTALRADVETRRADLEKLERTLQGQNSLFQETSRKLAVKESEITARGKDLQAEQARLAAAQQELTSTTEALKARQASLDREAARLAERTADIEARKADAQSRATATEAKMAEVVQRERVLTTELQRAENLMEDLGRKQDEIRAKEKTLVSVEADFGKRNAAVAHKEVELKEGMQALEAMRGDVEARLAAIDQDRSTAATAREEALALKAEADRAKAQVEAMEKEVAKNMKFLQKKAVDVLDREEKVREHDQTQRETDKTLEARAEILEAKEKEIEEERSEMVAKMERLQSDVDRLKGKISDAEKAAKPTAEMEDWKKEIDNRVKIIQRKAMDLLDREEKLRKREEELQTLAQQLGVKL